MSECHRDEPDLGITKPCFIPVSQDESPLVASHIETLGLEPHIEGGYFKETDVSVASISSPYALEPLSEETLSLTGGLRSDFRPLFRRLSTTIYYYLTPNRPQCHFHRNRSRIVHSLHLGRGRYVLISPDGHVETYVVGHNTEKGERLQWIIEGGVWQASYLLDAKDGENEGLLISETVVPGFEYADQEFLSEAGLRSLLPAGQAKELEWLESFNPKTGNAESKDLESPKSPDDSFAIDNDERKEGDHQTGVDMVGNGLKSSCLDSNGPRNYFFDSNGLGGSINDNKVERNILDNELKSMASETAMWREGCNWPLRQ
ncbi:Cupin-5 domain-containing protein [Fusarium falciforme]|uniref:Cupin-5 domain-containing protein n=1 Tax=Fusarium falciforme TaxID=195108 RepID=UPI00230157B3|nr:Cupin-5 domain-containing protein [Fusarium falciforme]WAO97206.1 Cupin-5 domain-containing protein [Fusarium falciforme]